MSRSAIGDSGLSFIELLAVMALVGVSIGITTTMIQSSIKVSQRGMAKMETMELSEEIQLIINDAAACALTFSSHCEDATFTDQTSCESGGRQWFSAPQLPANDSMAPLHDMRDRFGRVIFKPPQKYGSSVRISELGVRNLPESEGGIPSSGGSGYVNLVAKVEIQDGFKGQVEIERNFKVRSKTLGPLPASIDGCSPLFNQQVMSNLNTYMVTSVGPGKIETCENTPGLENCAAWVAKCKLGDLPIGGDCITTGATEPLKIDMDLGANMPNGTNCSGCPLDLSKCNAGCRNFEYFGNYCLYFDNVHNANSGARVLCLRR